MKEKRRIISGKPLEKQIKVDYIARTEGEAGIYALVSDSEVKELKFNIWEPARFFEGFLVGRMYYEVHDLVSRICGICPISHMTTALRALEKATGIAISEQTRTLRRILTQSQIVSSHIIHLYMLSAPDYMGYDSIIPVISEHPDIFKRYYRMKTAANKLSTLIGGRALHTMSVLFGKFTRIPPRKEFLNVADELRGIKDDALETVRFISRLPVPEFHSENIYASLKGSDFYPINEGRLASTSGLDVSEDEYRDHFTEQQLLYTNSKYSTLDGKDSFMVGALARINQNFDLLSDDARAIAAEIGFSVPNYNPYLNNLAQAIEIVNGIDDCIGLIDAFYPQEEKQVFSMKEGEGGAITEAPRGLLYHFYRVSKDGVIEKADIVTPTAHNASNLEKDLNLLLPTISHLDEGEITMRCEELIRAYDPCFSCSVH
ncbi:MAG TPA: nickel-dependent hydrogenase large subunit [Anaerolineae bacterium]|jgi:coenzyme F420-reducing hydrogenase alpha subunit|nr:nickel-dependent hydrogenase large subunit [Anaerolineae bacterium]